MLSISSKKRRHGAACAQRDGQSVGLEAAQDQPTWHGSVGGGLACCKGPHAAAVANAEWSSHTSRTKRSAPGVPPQTRCAPPPRSRPATFAAAPGRGPTESWRRSRRRRPWPAGSCRSLGGRRGGRPAAAAGRRLAAAGRATRGGRPGRAARSWPPDMCWGGVGGEGRRGVRGGQGPAGRQWRRAVSSAAHASAQWVPASQLTADTRTLLLPLTVSHPLLPMQQQQQQERLAPVLPPVPRPFQSPPTRPPPHITKKMYKNGPPPARRCRQTR